MRVKVFYARAYEDYETYYVTAGGSLSKHGDNVYVSTSPRDVLALMLKLTDAELEGVEVVEKEIDI